MTFTGTPAGAAAPLSVSVPLSVTLVPALTVPLVPVSDIVAGLSVRSVSSRMDSAGSVTPPATAAVVLVPPTILLFVEFWSPAL